MIAILWMMGCVFVSAEDHAARKALAGADTADVGDDTDSDTDTDTDAGYAGAGRYVGTFSLSLDDGLLDPEDCEGAATLDIDAEGRVTGAVDCERDSGGTIAGTVEGTAAGANASGSLTFTGDIQDNAGWNGFVVDSQGGTLTGDVEGTAEGGLLRGTAYDGGFEAIRED